MQVKSFQGGILCLFSVRSGSLSAAVFATFELLLWKAYKPVQLL